MVIKTDLDLFEIERELQEMMENGESDKETKSKHFQNLIFSVSMIVIAVIAII